MKRQTISFLVLLLLASWPLYAQDRPANPAPSPSPPPAPAGETPSFPAQVELVTVDVVVTDKKGAPVTGLVRQDFMVTEDGAPQSIATFEAVQLPAAPSQRPAPRRPRISSNLEPAARTGRSFIIVFDDVHLTPAQAYRAKTAIAKFLETGVREGDRVTLVASGGGAWWTARMESGRDELIALLKRLDGRHIPDLAPERITDHEAMRIQVFHDVQVEDRVRRRFETYGINPLGNRGRPEGVEPGDALVRGRASEVYYQAVSKNRITLEVVERVLNSLAATKGRKSLILVSEGFIYDPNLDEFKRVVQASRRANVAIYFVNTTGLEGFPATFAAQFGPSVPEQDIGFAFSETLEASEGAESIAADSGGFSVKNTNDLAAGIQRIADESRTYYLLGYNPTKTTRDGKFRKIQVRASRKGLHVRARKGYYAPLAEGKSALERKPTPADPDIQEALDSPYDSQEVPIRMTSYVFDETLLGKASVLMAAEVDLREFAFEEKEGRFVDTLEFLLVVAHRETGEYFRYDQKVDMKLLPETREKVAKQWFSVVRDFELAAGGYQAKIVVRDQRSRRIGTVIHEFDVPELGQLRTSSPLLSDTLQPAPEGSGSRPRPALLARRTFSKDATLYCQFEVYGAAKDKETGMPRVAAGYVIRRSDGTTLTRVDPTRITPTSLGKLSRLVGTPLAEATPGDYELVLSLRDEVAGKDLEVRESLTVETGS